jgi:signal transduction histidine kinase
VRGRLSGENGLNWAGEKIVRRRDGVLLTALVNNAPLYDTAGQLIGMIQVSTDVTERKLAELELQSSREQLRALAARLQSVREEERKGLSRDIHDELGQVLTGLKMELAWIRTRLQTPEAIARKALLKKIALLGSQIDAAANSIRKLCSELRPGILDDLGLAAAIEWQAREFTKRTGIKCELVNRADNPNLAPDGITAVFRIFQEILTNVARHARARTVRVHLEESQASLVLEASDDGRGIRPVEVTGSKSLGLVGMRERAMALGGTIEFQARAGGGTTVRLRLPLKSHAATEIQAPQEGAPRNIKNKST